MNPQGDRLTRLLNAGVLGALDVHFARCMLRLAGEKDEALALAAALVSRQVQAGHVCLDLARLCRGELALDVDADLSADDLRWPEFEAWRAALHESALVGPEDSDTPLHLDARGRLFLRRYLEHERSVAGAVRTRAGQRAPDVDARRLQAGLDRLFGAAPAAPTGTRQLELFSRSEAPDQESGPDLQRLAAERAVYRRFCVISGGPGTGKTSTVVKILALLVEQALASGEPPPRTHLLAPTGKAAARLSEAIVQAKATLPVQDAVRAAIAEQSSTIHRALGASPASARYRHDRESPLATDLVIVDEASMVDLALMARLLDAIPARARVILLGDKNQLASVEAGAVLGDICGTGLASAASDSPLAQSIVHLTRSYRYLDHTGIKRLAEAINAADVERALALLADPDVPDVSLVHVPDPGSLLGALLPAAQLGFAPFFAAQRAEQKLEALERYRVLCAHRRGRYGQLALNAAIEASLREADLIARQRERYAGRPILVTQNDPQARLFNGDVGILLPDPAEPSRLNACFRAANGQLREIASARLPPHESVYAMSVHKSQGSEFDAVAIVLPPEPSGVLSRELLYTAVTRARSEVVIYGTTAVIASCLERPVLRASGLREALWLVGG
jgi:exodeoxyribonuclease V alpha subunit